jgi:hypothetical protein
MLYPTAVTKVSYIYEIHAELNSIMIEFYLGFATLFDVGEWLNYHDQILVLRS